MARILKVFAQRPEQKALREYGEVIAQYDAFAIVEVARGKGAALIARFPCEDITDLYKLDLGGKRQVPPGHAAKLSATRRTGPTKVPDAGFHHYLVQFIGPVKRGWLARVAATGGLMRELYSDFTYIVRANGKGVAAIEALPFVRWVGHLPYEVRVAKGLRGKAPKLPRTHLRFGVYTVQVFDKSLLDKVAFAARELGFQVLSRSDGARALVLRSYASLEHRSRMVQTLATIHGVKFIRARAIMRTSNNVAAGIHGGTARRRSPVAGLSGRGEIVAVCDTGLDTGDPQTHPSGLRRTRDMRSRAIRSRRTSTSYVSNPGGNDGPADLDSGHGTHVAGSVLGDGAASAGLAGSAARSAAWRTRRALVFQAVEQEMQVEGPRMPAD